MPRHRFLVFLARSLMSEVVAKMGSCQSQPFYPAETVTQIFGVSITPRIWPLRKGQNILIEKLYFQIQKSFQEFLEIYFDQEGSGIPDFFSD